MFFVCFVTQCQHDLNFYFMNLYNSLELDKVLSLHNSVDIEEFSLSRKRNTYKNQMRNT